MKKLTLLILLFVPFIILSQNPASEPEQTSKESILVSIDKYNVNFSHPTTMEEFLYCTKGYKIQVESGIDPEKKGYILKSLVSKYDEFNTGKSVHLIGLYNENKNNLQAIICVLDNGYGSKSYYCIVNEDTVGDVRKEYLSQINSMNFSNLRLVMISITDYLTKELNKDSKAP